MLVFGCAVTSPELYESHARLGIELAREDDSELMVIGSAGSIFRNYNLILDKVSQRDDVEALILLHQDAEIVDPGFSSKVRAALADPQVGLVGCAGAIGVRSIAWWEGSVTWASFTHRFNDGAGGDVPALSWQSEHTPSYAHTGEVDAIDGFVMALPPWTIKNLRFDEALGRFHGYDFDFCLQVRAAGRKVVTADLKVIHHHSLELINDVDGWVEAHIRMAEKWESRFPEVGAGAGDWKERARRAEAQIAAARLLGYGAEQIWSSRTTSLEAALESMRTSASWKVTAPLRAAKHFLRRRR
jgi:hypothetical protein